MYPRETIYRLATDRDKTRCHALMRQVMQDDCRFGFPVVVGLRAGELLGFLSTHVVKDRIEAGPMVIAPAVRLPSIIAFRLVDAYEEAMRLAGVTAYCLTIPRTNTRWYDALVPTNLVQVYSVNDEYAWCLRTVPARKAA
jgi:hypothetical protein